MTQEHPLYFLRNAKGIIHVGANSGQESGWYHLLRKPVVWIEPIPEVFEKLKTNIANYKRQKAYQYLVTDNDGDSINFNISSNDGLSSSILELGLHRDLFPDVTYERTISMKSIKLDTLMEREGVPVGGYDTLIMDTQGSEILILRGATKLLPTLKWIFLECADFDAYLGCCRCVDIDAFLSSLGFKVAKRYIKSGKADIGSYFDVLYYRA